MPRNPSELARLDDELQYWKGILSSVRSLKSDKENALRHVRKIERELGLESKPYNGGRIHSPRPM